MSNSSTKELTVNAPAEQRDILMALLGEIGYEGFWENDEGFIAYIPVSTYSQVDLTDLLSRFGMGPEAYSLQDLADQNWNASWETNFPPVQVDDFCQVIAHFHEPVPNLDYTIRITPKMSFGTGHHATTRMMIRSMRGLEFTGKKVLDMGCGTGVLGILAEKMGATRVAAIDIDIWGADNAKENAEVNGCRSTEVILGDVAAIPDEQYDIILANINLNVLLSDIGAYARHLVEKGILVLSGFRPEDHPQILAEASQHGFRQTSHLSEGEWMAASFIHEQA